VGGIYILWDGVGAKSRFVFVEEVWIGSAEGVLLKYRSCLLITTTLMAETCSCTLLIVNVGQH